MHWPEGFIAVDWGTTNRRAYRISPAGTCDDEMEDSLGILAVGPGAFPAAIDMIRSRLGDLPMLMAGMIGSNRGWMEAPYVSCPAGVDEIRERLAWVEPGRVAIVPGLAFQKDGRADVMRGEEVQILGAIAADLIGSDGTLCHPGTHNKWIRICNNRIIDFRTVLTGELFSLLREHSILSDLLAEPAQPGPDFAAGVRHGLHHDDLPAELFSVRARSLLQGQSGQQAASFTSGLLIGNDLRIGLGSAGEGEIRVVGRPELTSLYAAALVEAGRPARQLDGETAFLAGVRLLAEQE